MAISWVTLALGMFHVTALVVGHVVGSKSTELGPFIVTLTLLSFPITFLTTDIMSEHCGHAVARRVSVLSLCCVVLSFAMIEVARLAPAAQGSHLPQTSFDHVFTAPWLHMVGLLTAYGFSQLADIGTFRRLRTASRGRHLWTRVLGSTGAGEVVNSVVTTAFLIGAPVGFLSSDPSGLIRTAWSQFFVRMAIVVLMLPLVYWIHFRLVRMHRGEH